MKLYEKLGDAGFHSSVISTFGIDFDAYESIALSRLRGAGCRNNVVLVDETMLALALDGASVLPRLAGRYYAILGAASEGVFHPKLYVQLGRRKGRVIVASANLTASGLAGNLELAGMLECSNERSHEQDIVAAAWRYLTSHASDTNTHLWHQLARMEAGAPWLTEALDREVTSNVSGPPWVELLMPAMGSGLMNQYLALIGPETVEQLVVLSPYWDLDGGALLELIARLRPRQVDVLIDPSTARFPASATAGLSGLRILDIRSIAKERFAHAKLFIARTQSADHVLFGSANCTLAALGRQQFRGTNEEASLYRQLSPGQTVEVLGLNELLAGNTQLSTADLPPIAVLPDRALGGDGSSLPGHFEYRTDRLIWRPRMQTVAENAAVMLFDGDMQSLDVSLDRLEDVHSGQVIFRISGCEQTPAFAKVRYSNGAVSSPAVVESVVDLARMSRESTATRTEQAIRQLEEETEIDLSLLEALDDLEAADREHEVHIKRKRKLISVGSDGKDETFRVLDYQAFIAGRQVRPDGATRGHVTMSGTEQSFGRQFLNRILSISGSHADAAPSDDIEESPISFDLGDEVADPEQAIESGETFGLAPEQQDEPRRPEEEERERNRKAAARRIENRHKFSAAVHAFADRVRSTDLTRQLTTADMLRQRAVLTILAAAGFAYEAASRKKGAQAREVQKSALQVLPMTGSDDCWPRLMGITIHALFGGDVPAIRKVQLLADSHHLPDDVLEFWASNFWAAQASVAATRKRPYSPKFAQVLKDLVIAVYRESGLTADERLGGRVMEVMDRMSDRFAERLGVDPDEIASSHRGSCAA